MEVIAIARPDVPQIFGSKNADAPNYAEKNGAPLVLTMTIFRPLTTHGELQSFSIGTTSAFPSSLARDMARKVYFKRMAMGQIFVFPSFARNTM